MLLLPLSAPGQADPGPSAGPGARADFLRAEIALAGTRQLYLVFDPAGDFLYVRRKHIDLLAIPVQASLGVSRSDSRLDPVWPAGPLTLASPLLEVERPQIDPAGRAVGDSTAAPATVEEIQKTRERYLSGFPSHYRLEFTNGLVVEIIGEAPRTGWTGSLLRAGRRLAVAWEGWSRRLSGDQQMLRLQLVMDPDSARRLYLVLEPAVPLLIAAPPPPSDR
ncbi:MAG: hypothetical protein ABIK96_08365 [bacterium]